MRAGAQAVARAVRATTATNGRAAEEAQKLEAALGEILAPKRKEYDRRVGAFREYLDETVQANTTEIWEFDNRMGDEIHPMHVHGVQFQILERTGGRGNLIATEKGWKDTVLLMPGEKVRIIMIFPAYTGVFVFHCHNLEHEDDGMMLNFEII